MKAIASASAVLAGLSIVSAELGFGPMRSSYVEGELIPVHYWTDKDYESVKMELVMLFNDHAEDDPLWSLYDVMLATDHVPACNETFSGYPMRDGLSDHKYAIWLTALDANTSSTGGATTGYAALSEPFNIVPGPSKNKKVAQSWTTASAAVGGLTLGTLAATVSFVIVRRLRASRRARAMTPPEWVDSAVEAALEKERLRVAMGGCVA